MDERGREGDPEMRGTDGWDEQRRGDHEESKGAEEGGTRAEQQYTHKFETHTSHGACVLHKGRYKMTIKDFRRNFDLFDQETYSDTCALPHV